ncbi:GNAT family N-acetyltransferase [Ureibacillus sp. 179-F W5.1 NHS]|uniref:N-acetyltransferase n=1 Tax=Lysinibacillus halotolerans TaxID=1368476 RepID=A0A3M8HG21_9BACI|nr:GNAT family protein [Lysinibacillus halotolerans]RND01392.1 N-acetyltransferase [Lysinibacillus halotolerans]
MNNIRFKKFENELDDLVSFMTKNTWEFHSIPNPSKEQIIENYHNGCYFHNRETFWILKGDKKIGLIVIDDINDTIPLFDIRLDKTVRGKGYGTQAVDWIVQYLFSLPDKKIRIEAHTRWDNLAMRKTLYNCRFVKEGYFRNAWENDNGTIYDSLCYAFIREDWEKDQITPIKLNEIPF